MVDLTANSTAASPSLSSPVRLSPQGSVQAPSHASKPSSGGSQAGPGLIMAQCPVPTAPCKNWGAQGPPSGEFGPNRPQAPIRVVALSNLLLRLVHKVPLQGQTPLPGLGSWRPGLRLNCRRR